MTNKNNVPSKDSTYLISDLHLEASRPAVGEAFQAFLDNISKDAQALYILGDFVDAWIGDDDNSPYYKKLKSQIAKFVADGTKTYFIHGNRDFLIGEEFSRETGVIILAENTCIDLYGNKVLLLHGDSLCTDDVPYQVFRKKVRNPLWQKKVLSYPLFVRKFIAAYMRYRSRKANSSKAENIMDVSPSSVMSAFNEYDTKIMIHGHTHRPNRHTYMVKNQEYERIVLGDWDQFAWYLRANEKNTELIKFPIEKT